jgi:hypothetical protein
MAISIPPKFPSPGHRRALHGLIRTLLFLRADEDAPKRRDFFRAGGCVVCEACGQEYHDHVQDPVDEWLTVLCSGERVKL